MHKIEWGNLSIFADAPYAGARIETDKAEGEFVTPEDAPYAGARIETTILRRRSAMIGGCPLCGGEN